MARPMRDSKFKGAAVELEIKKLEKAVYDLTHAITKLTASIKALKYNDTHTAKPSLAGSNDPTDVPKSVCSETQCGLINSETITCDHTLARYQSEYDCG